MPKSERTFTVQGSDIGETGGQYHSATPSAAAKKAARILFRKAKKNVKSIKFILRESTRTSEKKSYFYEGFVHHFDEPRVISRNGVDIQITKEIKVKTCKESQMTSVRSASASSSAISA